MGVTGDYTGFLPKEAWEWIQRQVDAQRLTPIYNAYNLPPLAVR